MLISSKTTLCQGCFQTFGGQCIYIYIYVMTVSQSFTFFLFKWFKKVFQQYDKIEHKRNTRLFVSALFDLESDFNKKKWKTSSSLILTVTALKML